MEDRGWRAATKPPSLILNPHPHSSNQMPVETRRDQLLPRRPDFVGNLLRDLEAPRGILADPLQIADHHVDDALAAELFVRIVAIFNGRRADEDLRPRPLLAERRI